MSDVIQFVDLRAQHNAIRTEMEAVISDVIDKSSFIGGNHLANFEKKFANFLGVNEVIGVGSGTDALWLGMQSLGIGNSDVVITTPNTFIATVEAITRTGAHPIFVDIDLTTANIDHLKLEDFLQTECYIDDNLYTIHTKTGKRVAAVVPVHLYGLPANIEPVIAIANKYNLLIIEDACQAHGAEYLIDGNWKRAGSLGNVSAFSFYPSKNLGALGDGGAVVTNDRELALRLRWLRDHGSSEKYVHKFANGWNSRLDALQAAVLSIKLELLDEWNNQRRIIASRYKTNLEDLPIAIPYDTANARHIYHLYVIRTKDRDYLRENLSMHRIQTGLHYPLPLHLQKAYEYLGYLPGSLPNSEKSASTILSLPMHPFMTFEQVDRVCEKCTDILLKAKN